VGQEKKWSWKNKKATQFSKGDMGQGKNHALENSNQSRERPHPGGRIVLRLGGFWDTRLKEKKTCELGGKETIRGDPKNPSKHKGKGESE